jgi:hypothetical protein
MKHYISICSDKFAHEAKKIDLFDWSVLATLPEYAQANKEDSMLVFNGYSDVAKDDEFYPRKESCLTSASSVFIDCDNPNSDPHIIDKWRKTMKDYDWMIYETASSTRERPKFRAIVPLASDIPWDKYTKNAIIQLFGDFADPKASWFFAPTLDKLNTIEENTTGRWMPTDGIMNRASKLRENEQIADSIRALCQIKWENTHQRKEDNWRFLPSVKKCLEGLHQGERDSSLNAACYAMDKNGYREHIREFLDEVCCDRSVKEKFYHKYR